MLVLLSQLLLVLLPVLAMAMAVVAAMTIMAAMTMINEMTIEQQRQHNADASAGISANEPISPLGETASSSETNSCRISLFMAVSPNDENG